MEYPFKVTYDTLPGGQFYEVDKKGKQTRVVLNDGHEFHKVYELPRNRIIASSSTCSYCPRLTPRNTTMARTR